jgi:hypothetical protein
MSSIYAPCPCKSGKKFKFCCYKQIQACSPSEIAKLSVQYFLHLCLIGQDWKEMGITNILVARKMPNDTFIVGLYLLDVWCLGIKSADLKINIKHSELLHLKEKMEDAHKLVSMPYEDIRSLIFGGVAYANNLGFTPHPDWIVAQHLIEPGRAFVDKFQFGKEGKPFYVAGPYDDCDEIMEKVQKINGDWLIPV